MTVKKKVATTLKNILDNQIMIDIMDKSCNLEETIKEIQSWWKYDLFSRKPGPAYENGIFVGTDLDMACFLYELADRNAVIKLPVYKGIRAKSKKEGQVVVSDKNRHGSLLGLNANKETFIFSARIKDMNVMTSVSVGDYRNFSLTDFEGKWYPGWQKIEFIPDAKENKFISESKILEKNTITFKNFSHPNRWTSFFGQYYFMTKALIDRLTEDASHYGILIKEMLNSGITYPPSAAPKEWPHQEKEKGKSIKVKAFQVEIDIPENNSEYPKYAYNQRNLVMLTNLRRDYINTIIPKLRFATRATELSYYNSPDSNMPSWLQDVKWEKDYKVKRTNWDRLVLFQPGVGKRSVAIRKRIYEKSEIVSKDYQM